MQTLFNMKKGSPHQNSSHSLIIHCADNTCYLCMSQGLHNSEEEMWNFTFQMVAILPFWLSLYHNDISDLNSFDFAMDVLKEVQVALVPGISFGSEGYFRISLVSDIPRLAEAAERLKKYVENHKK